MNTKIHEGFVPWKSDLDKGEYKNPVLFADYSDPDLIRVKDRFYMTASSFNCTPGLPILESTDLVNWVLTGHALKNLPESRYEECQPGCGVWAPAIRYHQGTFYIVFPTPDEGLYVVESRDPKKGWSEPWLLKGGKGLIDPCPFWDEDGKAYVVFAYAMSRAGIKSTLHLLEVSPDLKTVIEDKGHIVEAMGRITTLEGPKMEKRNGYYYILAPAGGVPTGYQMVFRSRSIDGPFEEKVVLAQKGTLINGPHQGALVDDIKGDWWFVHFQEYQPWGRIMHLQPAFWEDDWPLIGVEQDKEGVGRPVSTFRKPAGESKIMTPADSDFFEKTALGLQWQWNANHQDKWYRLTGHSLVLKGGEQNALFSHYPQILAQKINAPRFRAVVSLKFIPDIPGQEAGICMLGLESFRLGLTVDSAGSRRLSYSDDKNEIQGREIEDSEMSLILEMNEGGLCRFAYGDPGNQNYFGPAFHAVEGRWIGARFGLYCIDPEGTGKEAEFFSVAIN